MGTCKDPELEKNIQEVFLKTYTEKALKGINEDFFVSDRDYKTNYSLRILLSNCNNSVKIVGTSLCNKILGDETCRKILEKSNYPINIILTNVPNEVSEKIQNYFLYNFYEKIGLRKISHNLIMSGDTKKEAEFLVLDNKSYFFEIGSVNGGKIAIGNFNDSESVIKLVKKFDEIYNSTN
jgi:hypothetical protein